MSEKKPKSNGKPGEPKLKGKNGVYKRGNVYIAVVEGPRDAETGRRQRVWIRERFRTQKEAIEARDKLRDQIRGGVGVKPEKLTVADVVGRYIDHRVALGKVGDKAAERYRQLLRLNIEPHIGGMKIRALHKSHVSRLIATLLAGGKQLRKDGSARGTVPGLSATTVHHVHMLLKSALAWAVSVDIVARNVADIEEGPQRARSEADALTDEELGALLVAARGTRWEPMFMFALTTGLRRGELTALSRESVRAEIVDGVEHGSATVKASFSQTKSGVALKGTKTGRARQIPLPPMAIAALRAQAMVRAQDEFAAEGAYQDLGFVFADRLGRPLTPFAVTEAFRNLARKAGVSKRLHDLRHTAVSNLLAAGVDIVTVASIAGHSSVQTTLTTYAHQLLGMKEGAMAKLDQRYRAAIERDNKRRGEE